MTLHWFKPPTPSGETLQDMLLRLHPLGVRWRSWPGRQPDVTYQVIDGQVVAEIGYISVEVGTGEIGVWPYRGIGERESRILIGCAQHAFEHAPTKAAGWVYLRKHGRPRWQSSIIVKVDSASGVTQMVAMHYERMQYENQLTIGKAIFEVAP